MNIFKTTKNSNPIKETINLNMMFLRYSWIILRLIIKYFSLILLVALVLFLTKKYVDYSSTVYLIFIIPILSLLILINLIVIYTRDYLKYKKKKGNFRTSNIVILTLFAISVLHFSVNYYMENKSVYLSANLNESNTKLFLYSDKTFKIAKYWNHGGDNILGKYELKNNILTLKKDDLEKISNFEITHRYNIFSKDRIITTDKKGFKNLIFD
ncbi:hypothetical protein ASG21_10880 [Chryseobacterium sp. Leaf394]|nr:hypothetical protein ASG21_10880 [Chryseobacterium sp. Leaf394]